MLNIFYGRESLDKEKFIFDKIAGTYNIDAPIIIIVPDQYTLEAERQAFKYLKTESLMGLDIYSLSRLGHMILKEVGEDHHTFIDSYGRHMLLNKAVKQVDSDLKVYKGKSKDASFIELLNDFISGLKQYDISEDTLESIINELSEESLLYKKLSDVSLIYKEYDKEIKNKYTDGEDYINLFLNKIQGAKSIKRARIWIYGFDSFAPRYIKMIQGLMRSAVEVNVVLTYDKNVGDEDLFLITGKLINTLETKALEVESEIGEKSEISEVYKREELIGEIPNSLRHLEKELYSQNPVEIDDCRGITICEAANLYNEAESAAAHISYLIKNRGYRLRDIVLICNDIELRGKIIGRIFEEYGIPLFYDKKRGIINSNPSIFLIYLLKSSSGKISTLDLIAMLKTGLTHLDIEEIEKIEIYAIKYRIRGNMWKKPFTKGIFEYGEEGLEEIEGIRKKIIDLISPLEEIVKSSETNREFLARFYDYLVGDVNLNKRLNEILERQRKADACDKAEETQQIFNMFLSLMDQVVELIGDDAFEISELIEMLTIGLSQIEIGILPLSLDDLVMGTIERTRSRAPRALVIIGANEGILPAASKEDSLLGFDELEALEDRGFTLGKLDNIRIAEERLAIYRNLSRVNEDIWISYSISGEEGEAIRPSSLIQTIQKIFPTLEIKPDILNEEEEGYLVGGRLSTLRHLVERMRERKTENLWPIVKSWYEKNYSSEMEKIYKVLDFNNEVLPLDKIKSQRLFKIDNQGNAVLSPSKIETYAKCPFDYFIKYGLSPREVRIFEMANREIGDVYHECLMRVSSYLSANNMWGSIERDEIKEIVRNSLIAIAENYRDGLLNYGPEEEYRRKRIEETCESSIWALVEQIRKGDVSSSRYEAGFGKGRPMPPIEIKVKDSFGKENTVFVEGKIDRIDYLKSGEVKIIDYKSSNLDISENMIKAGYRLQLMLYIQGACMGEKEPAGVFYFHIHNPRYSGNLRTPETIEEDLKKSFKMKGITVNDREIIKNIAGDFEKTSDVISIKYGKEGLMGNSECLLLSKEDFSKLQDEVSKKVSELITNMQEGKININPMLIYGKSSIKFNACDYCDNKGICRFDLSFSGCNYNRII